MGLSDSLSVIGCPKNAWAPEPPTLIYLPPNDQFHPPAASIRMMILILDIAYFLYLWPKVDPVAATFEPDLKCRCGDVHGPTSHSKVVTDNVAGTRINFPVAIIA